MSLGGRDAPENSVVRVPGSKLNFLFQSLVSFVKVLIALRKSTAWLVPAVSGELMLKTYGGYQLGNSCDQEDRAGCGPTSTSHPCCWQSLSFFGGGGCCW